MPLASGQLILFGGAIIGGNRTFGEHLTWNGTTWTQIAP